MRKKFVLQTLMLAMISCTSAHVETWRMMEIPFVSSTDYTETEADAIRMDVQFVHKRTGETMPAVEATVKVDGSLVLPQRPDVEDWTLTVLI